MSNKQQYTDSIDTSNELVKLWERLSHDKKKGFQAKCGLHQSHMPCLEIVLDEDRSIRVFRQGEVEKSEVTCLVQHERGAILSTLTTGSYSEMCKFILTWVNSMKIISSRKHGDCNCSVDDRDEINRDMEWLEAKLCLEYSEPVYVPEITRYSGIYKTGVVERIKVMFTSTHIVTITSINGKNAVEVEFFINGVRSGSTLITNSFASLVKLLRHISNRVTESIRGQTSTDDPSTEDKVDDFINNDTDWLYGLLLESIWKDSYQKMEKVEPNAYYSAIHITLDSRHTIFVSRTRKNTYEVITAIDSEPMCTTLESNRYCEIASEVIECINQYQDRMEDEKEAKLFERCSEQVVRSYYHPQVASWSI